MGRKSLLWKTYQNLRILITHAHQNSKVRRDAGQSGKSRGELLDRLVAKEHKRVMRKENQ
jgi:hypothetical protein